MKIRIKFEKYGAMKFIGHLDAMRYFQKAVRRLNVKICYSGGFGPHQIMSFTTPLGAGITSNGEYVDIEVSSMEDSRTMVSRLNQVISKGLEIISFKELPGTVGNAMSIVATADYTVAFRPGYELKDMSVEEWLDGLLVFYEQLEVVVTKKTKRGQAELGIKPLIYDPRLTRGGNGNMALFMKISMGSPFDLRPELVLDAYYGHLGQERATFAFLIQREKVYTDLGDTDRKEKGDHTLIPLEELGQEIL